LSEGKGFFWAGMTIVATFEKLSRLELCLFSNVPNLKEMHQYFAVWVLNMLPLVPWYVFMSIHVHNNDAKYA
jgi:hypothetical protein